MQSGSLNRDTGALSEQSRFQLEEEAQESGFPLPLLLQASLVEMGFHPKGASLLFCCSRLPPVGVKGVSR